jgi:uncharacterized LabA/DUF88 family protein
MYVDGFNFYLAIKELLPSSEIYLGWCDFRKLATKEIIRARGELTTLKYFTAPVAEFGEPGGALGGEVERQRRWLSAVETIEGIQIIHGFHNGRRELPPSQRRRARKEKATDTNVAINLVLDAVKGLYKRAILVTGDYDQIPAAVAVGEEMPGCHVEVWLPPGRTIGRWGELPATSHVSVHRITPDMLKRSRLPDRITKNGQVIEAPAVWRQR